MGRNTQTVLDMSDWGAFFQLVRVKAPSPQRLAEMLRQSVKNSRKRGYHKEGMDFNRVHASGTSKILRKGESYLAAATLSAVDVEEHWSWADGETKYLDATCLIYDSKHAYVGHLDYNNTTLRRSTASASEMVHSCILVISWITRSRVVFIRSMRNWIACRLLCSTCTSQSLHGQRRGCATSDSPQSACWTPNVKSSVVTMWRVPTAAKLPS